MLNEVQSTDSTRNDIQAQLEQQTDRNKSIISAILNNTAFYVATSLQQILN